MCKKNQRLLETNKNRETYTETTQEGFIKNYKGVSQKEKPKFRKIP